MTPDLDALLTDALRGMFPHTVGCPRANQCWCGVDSQISDTIDAIQPVLAGLKFQTHEEAEIERIANEPITDEEMAHAEALRQKMLQTVKDYDAVKTLEQVADLNARLHEAEQARDDWRLITDGAKHDPRCPFNETDVGPRQAWPCLRCQMQAAEAREAALREALEQERESHRICTRGQAFLLDQLNAVEARTPPNRPNDLAATVGPERGDSGQLAHRNGFQFICEWRCPQCSQSEVAGHLASCCRLATPPTRSQS